MISDVATLKTAIVSQHVRRHTHAYAWHSIPESPFSCSSRRWESREESFVRGSWRNHQKHAGCQLMKMRQQDRSMELRQNSVQVTAVHHEWDVVCRDTSRWLFAFGCGRVGLFRPKYHSVTFRHTLLLPTKFFIGRIRALKLFTILV